MILFVPARDGMSQDHQVKVLVLRFAGDRLLKAGLLSFRDDFFRALGTPRKIGAKIGYFETWFTQPPFKAWSRPPPALSLTSMGVRGRTTRSAVFIAASRTPLWLGSGWRCCVAYTTAADTRS